MNYMRYKRSYVMLEENYQGMAQAQASRRSIPKGNSLKGFLKFETGSNKGLLRCSIQNLVAETTGDELISEETGGENLEETYLYKLFLVGKSGEKLFSVDTGKLHFDKQGNGSLVFRFNPLDLKETGLPLHLFTKAVVASAKDFSILMEANLTKTPLELSAEKISELLQPKEEEIEKQEEKEEEALENPIIEMKSDVDVASSEDIKELNQTTEKEDVYQESTQKKKSQFDPDTYYKGYLKNSSEHMSRVTGLYEKVAPFKEDSSAGNCNWWKVMNVMSLPFVNINAHPSCHDLAYKYHHYIFGVCYSSKGTINKFCFGIPGKYCEEEHPDEGKSGFSSWQPIKDANCETGAYGYWLLFIDSKTGDFTDC